MADKFIKAAWKRAKVQATYRSMLPDYKGCSVFINAIIGKDAEGVPCITGFSISDWYGGETVATFINGKERS